MVPLSVLVSGIVSLDTLVLVTSVVVSTVLSLVSVLLDELSVASDFEEDVLRLDEEIEVLLVSSDVKEASKVGDVSKGEMVEINISVDGEIEVSLFSSDVEEASDVISKGKLVEVRYVVNASEVEETEVS